MWWKSSDEFILLNVSVFDFGSHYSNKGVANLFRSSYMITHLIASVFLISEWLMVNVFCGRAVTGLNPVTSYFSVFCFYFNCTWWWMKNYISNWSMVLHMNTFNLPIFLSLLFSYLMQFLVTINIICNSASIQLHLWNTFLYGPVTWFVSCCHF